MPEVRILQLDCVEAVVAYLTTLQSDALLDLCSEEKLNISVAETRASVKRGQKVSNSQLVAIILKKQLTAWSYVIDLPISTRVNLLEPCRIPRLPLDLHCPCCKHKSKSKQCAETVFETKYCETPIPEVLPSTRSRSGLHSVEEPSKVILSKPVDNSTYLPFNIPTHLQQQELARQKFEAIISELQVQLLKAKEQLQRKHCKVCRLLVKSSMTCLVTRGNEMLLLPPTSLLNLKVSQQPHPRRLVSPFLHRYHR